MSVLLFGNGKRTPFKAFELILPTLPHQQVLSFAHPTPD